MKTGSVTLAPAPATWMGVFDVRSCFFFVFFWMTGFSFLWSNEWVRENGREGIILTMRVIQRGEELLCACGGDGVCVVFV